MQNYTKSQTRLAFVQFIFQSEFINVSNYETLNDFQNYFYNSNISIIGDKKEFKIKFNKNLLTKLSKHYINNFNKVEIINQLNNFIDLERKFEKWNSVLKSLILAIISELEISDKQKIKIIINDYMNIAKSLVTLKEVKLMNAIIQKYIDEKNN